MFLVNIEKANVYKELTINLIKKMLKNYLVDISVFVLLPPESWQSGRLRQS